MASADRLSIAGPESRGAAVLSEQTLRRFLTDTVFSASQRGGLCGLVLTELRDVHGCPVGPDDQRQAANVVSQLMRQADAVGILSNGSLAIVLHALDRRGDAHVMLDRLEAFARAASLPWALTIGVAVYPLSGQTAEELWQACARDLEGAMSSDTWEHLIPRDTLLTRSAG